MSTDRDLAIRAARAASRYALVSAATNGRPSMSDAQALQVCASLTSVGLPASLDEAAADLGHAWDAFSTLQRMQARQRGEKV